jgi:hypothetical protein
MRARGGARRVRHEIAAGGDLPEPPSPEAVAERLEAQQVVARLVLELDPPVRDVLFLRYYEDLSAAEISRRLGVPAGTVRWRLKCGLDVLRAELDRSLGGRRRWAVLLLPAVDVTRTTAGAIATTLTGVLTMKKAIVGVIVALLLVGIVLVGMRGRGSGRGGRDEPAGVSKRASQEQGARAHDASTRPERPIPASFVQPGVPDRRIAGQVVFQGAPVPGARIVATSVLAQVGLRQPEDRLTGSDGRFDFGELAPATYTVIASATGRGPAQIGVDLLDPTLQPRPDKLLLELQPCAHDLYGVVMDNSGGPIRGAEVRIAGVANVGTGTTTDADGRYDVCFSTQRMFVTEAVLGIHADGYGDLEVVRDVIGRVRVDLVMTPAGTLVGRVVAVGTGEGLANAYVWLAPEGALPIRPAKRVAAAGDDGRFRIEALPPGRYRLGAHAPGLLQVGIAVDAMVQAGLETPEVQIAMDRAARVEGVILGHGKPVAGARLQAIGEDGQRRSGFAVSQADGRFVLTSAPLGVVSFEVAGYVVVSPERLKLLAPIHAGVIVEVRTLGAIEGTVARKGTPVGGAEVTARGGNAPPPFPSTRSAPDGTFAIRGLAPAEYQVFAASDTAFTREPRDLVAVTLGPGEVRDGVVVNLGGGASIHGVVVDAGGGPVEGVYVEYVDRKADDLCRSWTDQDGRFVCAMIAGGAIYFPAVKPSQGSHIALPPARGHEFPGVLVADGDSEIRDQRLVIDASSKQIRGAVVSTDDEPVADAIVRATESGANRTPANAPWATFPFAITDVNGAFDLRVWDGGTYDLFAASAGGGEATRRAARAGQSDIVLRVEAPGRIEGDVTGFPETPSVRAQRLGDAAERPVTVVDGKFVIQGLPGGAYWVWAVSGAGGDAEQVTLVPGGVAHVTLANQGTVRVEGRVVDFLTNEPVPGAACYVGPYLGGHLIYRNGVAAPPADAAGRFAVDAPSGDSQVHCHGSMNQSDGVARVDTNAGAASQVVVPIVVMRHPRAQNSAGLDFAWWESSRAVTAIRPGSRAASADIRLGDVVAGVDGRAVETLTSRGVRFLIGDHELGETVAVTLRRGASERSLSLPVEGPLW